MGSHYDDDHGTKSRILQELGLKAELLTELRSTWRGRCRPVIVEVIERVGREDERVLRRELRNAFPFGVKAYYPYRVWLDEIKVQLNKKRKPGGGPGYQPVPMPNQKELFPC